MQRGYIQIMLRKERFQENKKQSATLSAIFVKRDRTTPEFPRIHSSMVI